MDRDIKNLLLTLIDLSEARGLGSSDLNNARDFLRHNEFGLCFDTIITQMYEYDIKIDESFYRNIEAAANNLKIPERDFSFMKELIKG